MMNFPRAKKVSEVISKKLKDEKNKNGVNLEEIAKKIATRKLENIKTS